MKIRKIIWVNEKGEQIESAPCEGVTAIHDVRGYIYPDTTQPACHDLCEIDYNLIDDPDGYNVFWEQGEMWDWRKMTYKRGWVLTKLKAKEKTLPESDRKLLEQLKEYLKGEIRVEKNDSARNVFEGVFEDIKAISKIGVCPACLLKIILLRHTKALQGVPEEAYNAGTVGAVRLIKELIESMGVTL
jgi:hypothetical protein